MLGEARTLQRKPMTKSESVPKIASSHSVRSHAGLFGIAIIFAVVGGFTDAYAYLARGHVFANAQTGNIVLFAVHVSEGNWESADRTIPPIFAYALGIAVGKLLRVRPQKRSFHATLICQGLELFVLLTLWVLGTYVSDLWAVPMISFCSALQNASFSNIGTWSFNSSMTTGNIRKAVSSFVDWCLGEQPKESRSQVIVASTIALCFALGALLGALCTHRFSIHALGFCVVLVAAGILATFRERRRLRRQSC